MSDGILFDVPRQLSPYKEWERKHRIKTHFAAHCEEEPWCASQTIQTCGHSVAAHGDRYTAFGTTRDEAIRRLCEKLNIPFYGAQHQLRCTALVGGRVCGGVMRRGEAIPQAIQWSSEGTGSFANWTGPAPRVSVLKCKKCGHSFQPPVGNDQEEPR